MLVTLLYETYLDKTILRNVQRWKEEPLFPVTRISATEPMGIKVSTYSPSLPIANGDTKLRRRISRTKSLKAKQNNHNIVRRVSSTEVGQPAHRPLIRERFVNLSSENISYYDKMFTLHQNDDFSKSEEDVFQDSNPVLLEKGCHDLDHIIDSIHKVSISDTLTNARKIQYMSNILSRLDLRKIDGHEENVDISPHSYNLGNVNQQRQNCNRGLRHTVAKEITDLSNRLSKSLDNVQNPNLMSSEHETEEKRYIAVSLMDIAIPEKEHDLWREVENFPTVSSAAGSRGSLGTCDADVSSRSNDDTDDVDDSCPLLRRDRPMRQNVRRKR